jgi:hypothetical protein
MHPKSFMRVNVNGKNAHIGLALARYLFHTCSSAELSQLFHEAARFSFFFTLVKDSVSEPRMIRKGLRNSLGIKALLRRCGIFGKVR